MRCWSDLQGLRSIEKIVQLGGMDWYYAINGKRIGPVSDTNFAQLVANGAISDDTLVWHKGMAEWAPWESVAAQTSLPPAERIETGSGIPTGADTAAEGESWTTEEFWARLQQNGFTTSVGGCLGRAWQVYKTAFWPCFGVTLLGYFVLMVVGLIPLVGFLSTFFASPHLNAGLMQYFANRSRGEAPGVETLFVGYSRGFGSLAGVGLMQLLIAIVPAIVMAVALGSMGLLDQSSNPDLSGGAAIGGMLVIMAIVLVMMFVFVRLLLAPLILTDLGATTGEAMKLSWRIVGQRIWVAIGLAILLMLMALGGMLALFIGLLFVMPMYPAVFAQLYEDARLSAAGQPPVA